MYVLNALPDEITIPLDEAKLKGVVAHVRPLDADQLALWVEAMHDDKDKAPRAASFVLVGRQLIAIDGLNVRENGVDGAFDPANQRHLRSLPVKAVQTIYAALIDRAELTEVQEKNSDSPSALGQAPSMATSSVDGVASGDATSTSAG